MPTDEQIARLLSDEFGIPETTMLESWEWYLKYQPAHVARMRRLAHTIREALTQPVEPMPVGERLAVKTTDDQEVVCYHSFGGGLVIDGGGYLEEANVRALRLVCDRWLAAQEEQ